MKPIDPMKEMQVSVEGIVLSMSSTPWGRHEAVDAISRAATRLVVDAAERIIGADEPVKILGERKGSQVESDIHAKIRNRLRFKQRQRLEFYRALLDGEVGIST